MKHIPRCVPKEYSLKSRFIEQEAVAAIEGSDRIERTARRSWSRDRDLTAGNLRPLIRMKTKTIDPLYQLFEHYLVTRSYEDTAAFTKQLAEQYLVYLDSTPAHVPFQARTSVLEDLASEAHEMLVKKMYGCVRVTDYVNYGSVIKVNKSDNALTPFDFTPQISSEQNPNSNSNK